MQRQCVNRFSCKHGCYSKPTCFGPGSLSRRPDGALLAGLVVNRLRMMGRFGFPGCGAACFPLCGGQRRVLDQGQPHAGPPYDNSHGPGGRDPAQTQMGPHKVVVQ